MSQADAARAVNALRDVVLKDPALREIARTASTPVDLEALWNSERFRAVHEDLVKGVTDADVREYLAELSDEQLDGVAGGVSGVQLPPTLSPRDNYLVALGAALKRSQLEPCL